MCLDLRCTSSRAIRTSSRLSTCLPQIQHCDCTGRLDWSPAEGHTTRLALSTCGASAANDGMVIVNCPKKRVSQIGRFRLPGQYEGERANYWAPGWGALPRQLLPRHPLPTADLTH